MGKVSHYLLNMSDNETNDDAGDRSQNNQAGFVLEDNVNIAISRNFA